MNVDVKIKDWFFDKPRVLAAVKDTNRRALSKIGAFLRTRARSLLRRRKAVSAAGSPPSIHSTSAVATLKYILFGYDPFQESVVVGPVKLNQVSTVNGVVASGTLPQLMEFGGDATITEVKKHDGSWWRRDGRRTLREGEVTRKRTAHYAPRPFMGPALQAEIAKGTIAAAWADSLRGAA